MYRLTPEQQGRSTPSPSGDWRERTFVAQRPELSGPPVGLLIAGGIALGLGLMAWYYLGPDLRRYLKLRSM
jgi:hypothetical protein